MNKTIPIVNLFTIEQIDDIKVHFSTNSEKLFMEKRIVLFSVPGAFTPVCTNYQLPEYELYYDDIISYKIDDVYCISVNDPFVMDAWGKYLDISNVKLISDGNGDFTGGMEMLVEKYNYGLSYRSWRYAAVIDNGFIEKFFVENGKENNSNEDPYEETTAEKIIEYLSSLF